MNSFMLVPQADELDIYANGQQIDDINTIVEYIQQEVLDIPDETPEDEDDDKGQNLISWKFGDEACQQGFTQMQIDRLQSDNSRERFPVYKEKEFLISYDITTPPPKAWLHEPELILRVVLHPPFS